MGNYVFDFSFVIENLDVLLVGLQTTIKLTVISSVIGLIAGFCITLMTMSRYRVISWSAIIYIEIFRCTPALVQLIWIFYCVPIFFGIFIEPIPMAIVALSLNIAAYNAEAYRAAIQAIPKSHHDASVALGLSPVIYMLFVILPQAFIIAIPVLVTNTIGLLQQSALVAIVGIPDLMYEAKNLASASYRPIEVFTVAAAIYLLIAFPFSYLVNRLENVLERRMKGSA